MAASDDESAAIQAAVASLGTCTTTDVQRIRRLLGLQEKTPANQDATNDKRNPQRPTSSSSSRTQPRSRPPTSQASRRPRAAKTYCVREDARGLSAKKQLLLATEVINAALRLLSEFAKAPAKAAAKGAPTNTSKSNAAVPPLSPKKTANSRTTASATAAQRSKRVPAEKDRKPNVENGRGSSDNRAVAECAHAAFTFLGKHISSEAGAKDLPPLQYESGMISFISKLISARLDAMALKELLTLKKRLDLQSAGNPPAQAGGKPTEEKPKTLATLLSIETPHPESNLRTIQISHQLLALKFIANRADPGEIRASLQYLRTDRDHAAQTLLLELARNPKFEAKSLKQLDTLAQTMLSMCPSISSADDSAATDSKRYPDPTTVLELQALALYVQLQKLTLGKAKPSIAGETLESFSRCLNAYGRRCRVESEKMYRHAKDCYKLLSQTPLPEPVDSNMTAVASIKATLCSMARSARLLDEALLWADETAASPADTKNYLATIRNATILLECGQADPSTVEEATKLLNNNGPHLPRAEVVLVEVAGFRKSATKSLLSTSASKPKQDAAVSPSPGVLCRAIFGCIKYFADYTNTDESGTAVSSRIAKAFIDSALVACRVGVSGHVSFKELDLTLSSCLSVIEVTVGRNSDDSWTASHNLISNIYWASFLKSRSGGPSTSTSLDSLRGAVAILQNHPEAARQDESFSLKLVTLSKLLYNEGHFDESFDNAAAALRECIANGMLKQGAQLAATKPLREIFERGCPLELPGSCCRSLLHASGHRASPITDVLDMDAKFGPSERGTVLEYLLLLACGSTHSKRTESRQQHEDAESLVNALHGIYTQREFPLRRLRVNALVLRAASHTRSMFSHSLVESCKEDALKPIGKLAHDEGLEPFELDITASAIMATCLQSHPIDVDRAQGAIALWRSLTSRLDSEIDLGHFLNDSEATIGLLQSSADLFALHGEQDLQLQCLRSLASILELGGVPKADQLLKTYISLSQAYTETGRSSEAELLFSKSRSLTGLDHVSTDTKLHWNLAYGQYLLTLGNAEASRETLAAASSLFENAGSVQHHSESTGTLSERLKTSRILVEACFLQSQLDAVSGSFESALCHARRCITLDRRMWATLETRQKETSDSFLALHRLAEKTPPTEHAGIPTPVSDVEAPHPSKLPVVMSMTHSSLSGPAFWNLIPPMVRSLCHYSQLLATQGIYQDALYWLDQAYKVAATISSAHLKHNIFVRKARLLLDSGRLDEAAECVHEMKEIHSEMPESVYSVQLHLAEAALALALSDDESAIDSADKATETLKRLAERQHASELVVEMEQLWLDNTPKSKKTTTRTRTTRAQPKTQPKTVTSKKPAAKKVTRPARGTSTVPCEDSNALASFEQTAIFKVDCKLRAGDVDEALQELDALESAFPLVTSRIEYQVARLRVLEAHAIEELSRDVSLSVLPESSISFPSWNRLENLAVDLDDLRLATALHPSKSSPRKRLPGRAPAKSASKSNTSRSLLLSLEAVRNRAIELMQNGLKTASPHHGFRVCNAVAHLTMLLSVSEGSLVDAMPPQLAAFSLDIPRVNATKREQTCVRAEAAESHLPSLLAWPQASMQSDPHSWISIPRFQSDYIDIIPTQWSVISINLNDALDELYVVRYEAGQSPFTVRLPMVRHNSRDQDEDVFSFECGKAELEEIIEQSNWSAHHVPENGSKAEKKEWWEEREALDARLRDLLLNIENIWLGGFKGILSRNSRSDRQMAQFQTTFEKILNRYLPSRKRRGASQRFNFDPRVLELFIGLGNPDDGGADLDEHLLDLLYFVVDILQFNGESNAYDEVDFDSICVETIDALQVYHLGIDDYDGEEPHTILILDKRLLPFPWECLPCLIGRPVSRLTSLEALRSRILSMADTKDEEDALDGHRVSIGTGTTILNPSGDLRGTEASLKPFLSTLPSGWTHHSALPEPTSSEPASATPLTRILQETPLLLYFGHGSTSQYARARTVRALPSCPTTWLMGCSSGGVTDNGQFEPHGMILSYLGAGAPAVVGALWDVTDRDTDRFSVRMGSEWGLWDEAEHWEEGKRRGGKGAGKERADTAARTAGAVRRRVHEIEAGEATTAEEACSRPRSLVEAVARARDACYLKYLNGAAMVVYGIPVYLGS